MATAEAVHLISEKGFDLGENLYPYMGCCFCVNSIYPKYPECLGGICEVTCCCMAADVMVCKPSPGNPEHCCTLLRAQIDCVKLAVCIKSRSQFLCCDFRAAIPPDAAEVPCMVSILGMTCCYDNKQSFNCCATLAKLKETKEDK